MRFYYTTTKKYLDVQKDPSLSLGGFPSSTVINNFFEGNFFDSLSSYTIVKNKEEVIAIVLKNEIADIESLFLWLDYPENALCKIELAFVGLSDSSCGPAMESISDRYSRPYIGTFYEPVGEENKINLGPLKKNEYLGIFVKRSLREELRSIPNDILYNNYINNTPLEKLENISIKMNW